MRVSEWEHTNIFIGEFWSEQWTCFCHALVWQSQMSVHLKQVSAAWCMEWTTKQHQKQGNKRGKKHSSKNGHKFRNINYLNDSLKSNEIQRWWTKKKCTPFERVQERAHRMFVCIVCIRVAMHCCLYHNLVLFMADTLSPSFLTVVYHLFSPNCYCSSTNETQFCIW